MLSVLFSILVVIGLISILGELIMRIRLTKSATRDKIAWWRRSGDEVAATYEELFPHSRLPLFRRFVFWFFVGVASTAFVVLVILRKSN
jgi:hypothetical protein